ncbi:MAG: DNA-processing protein DprA [Gemmatimonadota bacterium]|nr:DNA-processing protein DprA [Gemmatimonadota bacterium]
MPVTITCLTPASAHYPESLLDLASPPQSLYSIGSIHALSSACVALVGTRDPTTYGLRMAWAISAALSRAGVCVVSGMARGIDAECHRAMLAEGGNTAAVLGTGVDVAYPAAHRELHRLIGEKGLVLSENPPGARAHRGAFPRRNRIIAALAKLTIVVEAGHRSGALNTATQALELGRVVAAVPGPIDSPQSEGTNQLIRDGACVIASIGDALTLAGVSAPPRSPPAQLAGDDARVWSALDQGPLMVDDLATRAGMPARECLTAVTSLELIGMVECLVTGAVRRR